MAGRLFLERGTYRQNRLQDAARLLPILGLILLFGPIFIRGEGDGTADVDATLSGGLIYYFAVWLGLIVLTALVSRALVGASPPEVGAGEVGVQRAAPPAGEDA